MNLEDFQQNEQYADSEIDETEILFTIEFDEVDVDFEIDVVDAFIFFFISIMSIFALSAESIFFVRRQSIVDTFEPVEHERVRIFTLNDFGVVLNFWCEKIDIFRNQYDGLYEILSMLKSHTTFNNLLESLTIFKRHTKNKLPILFMRKKLINFIFEKQFITTESRKKANSKLTSNEDFVFFDFKISINEINSLSFEMC